jgi:hypothetical protein
MQVSLVYSRIREEMMGNADGHCSPPITEGVSILTFLRGGCTYPPQTLALDLRRIIFSSEVFEEIVETCG